jgi:hypothetical protein
MGETGARRANRKRESVLASRRQGATDHGAGGLAYYRSESEFGVDLKRYAATSVRLGGETPNSDGGWSSTGRRVLGHGEAVAVLAGRSRLGPVSEVRTAMGSLSFSAR